MNNGLLEQARTFVAIVNNGSLSAAATFLGVAQPTVSRQLVSLEESLNCTLIQRSTRALTLTAEGEQFLPHAIRMVETADGAIDAMRPVKSSFTGRLRVSCSHAFAKRILIPSFPLWQRLHPNLHLDLVVSDEIEPIVPLGLDIAIRVGQLKDSSLIARKIGQFDRWLVASKSYLATRPPIEAPSDLKAHNCLVVAGRLRRPWAFKSSDETVTVTVDGALSLSTVDSLRDGVLAGIGVAVTPSWFWTERAFESGVVRLLEDYQTPRQSVYAVSAHRHASDSKEFAFVEFVREAFRPHSVD